MHISSLWFPTSASDSFIKTTSNTIAFLLTDVVAQITEHSGAGINVPSQDNTLGDSSLTAAIAQEAYVGNRYNNFHSILHWHYRRYTRRSLRRPTLVDGSPYQQNATYEISTFRHVAMYVLVCLCRIIQKSLTVEHLTSASLWPMYWPFCAVLLDSRSLRSSYIIVARCVRKYRFMPILRRWGPLQRCSPERTFRQMRV